MNNCFHWVWLAGKLDQNFHPVTPKIKRVESRIFRSIFFSLNNVTSNCIKATVEGMRSIYAPINTLRAVQVEAFKHLKLTFRIILLYFHLFFNSFNASNMHRRGIHICTSSYMYKHWLRHSQWERKRIIFKYAIYHMHDNDCNVIAIVFKMP